MTNRTELNTNAKIKGNLCEAIVFYRCVKLGWKISIPYGDNCKYDFIVDKLDGTLHRVQVKSASRPEDKNFEVLAFPLETRNKQGYTPYTSNDIDAFIAVDLVTENIYWVPIQEAEGQRYFNLRLEGGKKNVSKTKWAKDYIL